MMEIDFGKLNISGILRLCLSCNTKEEAESVLKQYAEYQGSMEIACQNLGYIFGYCNREDREKLYSLFPVSHPIFGSDFGRSKEVSACEAFSYGMRDAKEYLRKLKKEPITPQENVSTL